jgi:hypothetical protein
MGILWKNISATNVVSNIIPSRLDGDDKNGAQFRAFSRAAIFSSARL